MAKAHKESKQEPETTQEEGTLVRDLTAVELTAAILDAAEDGSSFLKERGQWRVSFVKNGHALACGGATIPEAVASIGGVRTHDSLGNVL